MASAPTLAGRTNTNPSAQPSQASQGGQNPNASVRIPFTRAARMKSRNVGQYVQAITAAQTSLPPIQLPAAGYIRKVRLQVTGVAAGNSATVAFQPDAPYNVLQQISVLAANGDSLIVPTDGFVLAMLHKYGMFANSGPGSDPRADPAFNLTTGAGASGGSFTFNIDVPFELDTRDALCALANMAANQSFLLQFSLAAAAAIYSTPPTVLPTVTVTAVMEYWSAPSDANGSGVAQATAPPANGSVSLIQVQNPVVAPGTGQNIQLVNVGNTIRFIMLILRTSAGARTETDWPNFANIYVNNDLWFYKTKNNWRKEMQQRYNFTQPTSATPAIGAGDNGVYVISDFIAQGSGDNEQAQSTSNRNLWLPTNSATALNFEAQVWGGAANNLQIVTNSIRPSDPAALYQPFLI